MTEPATKSASFRALLPLLRYGRRYSGRAFLALAALTTSAAATLAVPFALRRMIDFGFSKDAGGAIDAYFLAMGAVVLVIALAAASRYYLVTTLGERVVADLRRDVFAHLTGLDAAFYDRARIGELVSRLTADTTQIKSAFGSSASQALRNLFMFVGSTALMVYTSPKLSALVLVAIPVIAAPLIASGRVVRGRSRHAQDTLADATAFASESLGAVRTMQAFGAEAGSKAHFARAVEGAYEAARNATLTRAILIAGAVSLAFCSVVFVLWLGAHDVLAGRMSAGLLSQFVLFAVLGATSLGELSQVWSETAAAAGAAGRISELLAIEPLIVAPKTPVPMPAPPRGAIAFEHVVFAYDGAPGTHVIDDLSFSIAAGERVAIVGPSGAGKSTVLHLIMRFYDCQEGRVLVDGVDVRSADPSELRARIAPVPQEASIFGGTVSENIAYGRGDASERDIEAAARRAAADGFIRDLDKGYATELGERGVTLSGGQRQRLAIARAILKGAPILLLDEATSALDAHNEAEVQAALDDVMSGRTTLVIAHRLATVLKADRILVMEAGRIVEEGDHATLIAKGGVYARLARLQFEPGAAALRETSAAHTTRVESLDRRRA
ncbi:MAG: ABC transporter transmembrane domain-containing protein [Roseiarcus sp.]|uniref:ABC transporter transmembrane domain-containing protein n=1 Tax=Roseiarcus sp. TaxID=1969460 RepID=UPI003BB07253